MAERTHIHASGQHWQLVLYNLTTITTSKAPTTAGPTSTITTLTVYSFNNIPHPNSHHFPLCPCMLTISTYNTLSGLLSTNSTPAATTSTPTTTNTLSLIDVTQTLHLSFTSTPLAYVPLCSPQGYVLSHTSYLSLHTNHVPLITRILISNTTSSDQSPPPFYTSTPLLLPSLYIILTIVCSYPLSITSHKPHSS